MNSRIALAALLAVASAACGGSDDAADPAEEPAAAEEAGEEAGEEAAEEAAEPDVDDENDVDIDAGDDGIVVTGSDAAGEEAQIVIGASEIPDDFPMPIPEGAEVVHVSSIDTSAGSSTSVTVEIDPAETPQVIALYEQWYADQGLETMSSETMVIADSDSVASLVQITDYGDYAEVILTWSPTA